MTNILFPNLHLSKYLWWRTPHTEIIAELKFKNNW